MSLIQVPVSYGELIDKITILEIKAERIAEAAKLRHIRHELNLLEITWQASVAAQIDLGAERAALAQVNRTLWQIEDAIRLKERGQSFDHDFIALARSVYRCNDERAAIKRAINLKLGSELVEEKSYQDYAAPAAS